MQALRSYMAEEITSDKFDCLLLEIRAATHDETVEIIGKELWAYYDDLKDHLIVASKQEWDFFNRVLLLLGSGAEIKIVRSWGPWHVGRFIAAIALAFYIYVAARSGFEPSSIGLLAAPCCAISVALDRFNRKRRAVQGRKADALTPFTSVQTMLAVRRSIKGFVRRQYPQALETRRIRGPVETAYEWIVWGTVRLGLSPIILFIQIWPDREARFAMADGGRVPC